MKINYRSLNVRLFALLLLVIGIGIGLFVFRSEISQTKPFRLGLDLSGGSYLVYRADVSKLADGEIKDRTDALRDVIERRVNLFGVAEPSVQTETTTLAGNEKEYRLVVELPGVTDLDEAIATIGQTPLLEFKIENPDFDEVGFQEAIQVALAGADSEGGNVNIELPDVGERYLDTELTGAFLSRAVLQFQQGITGGNSGGGPGSPIIALEFNKEGGELFAELTGGHVGETIAIYLDGSIISAPVVQQEITGGEAVITGVFTPEEARTLVGRLNSGALPVPIELINTQTIGPSLGAGATTAGVQAGLYGFLLVALFLVFWYRLPGLLAVISLAIYSAIMLALFKSLPVTLTAAGIAGFIISLGIAVDANILIFERMKEELSGGRTVYDAAKQGFARAWSSIRDANVSSLISAVILFWFGSPLIKGFALTFGIGVVVSMLSAIIITRVFLFAVSGRANTPALRWLYSAGFLSGKTLSAVTNSSDEENE
jgi:preprotein translocase subunit SecD